MTESTSKLPTDKMVEELAETARHYLDKIASPGLEETGGLLQDTVKYWRFKNQVNIILKAKNFLERKGIEPKVVLPSTLIPILESGSLESEGELSDAWSSMLASYIAGEVKVRSYPNILRNISLIEIKILRSMNKVKEGSSEKIENGRYISGTPRSQIIKAFKLTDIEYEEIIDNLMAQNLVQPVGASGMMMGKEPISVKTKDILHVTDLGSSFLKSIEKFSLEKGHSLKIVEGPKQNNTAVWG